VNYKAMSASIALALLFVACGGKSAKQQIHDALITTLGGNLVATIEIGAPVPASDPAILTAEAIGYVRTRRLPGGKMVAELTAAGRAASRAPKIGNPILQLELPTTLQPPQTPTYDVVVARPTITRIVTMQPGLYRSTVDVALRWKYKLTRFGIVALTNHFHLVVWNGYGDTFVLPRNIAHNIHDLETTITHDKTLGWIPGTPTPSPAPSYAPSPTPAS